MKKHLTNEISSDIIQIQLRGNSKKLTHTATELPLDKTKIVWYYSIIKNTIQN